MIHLSALSPADGMALTMVALLAFSLGMILTILWVMARNAGRQPDIEDGLIEKEDDEASPPEKKPTGESDEDPTPSQPWEKDGDWWKS